MAHILTALRAIQLADTREVFRIEAEVSGGQVSIARAHCEFRHRNQANAIIARQPGYRTIERLGADLPAGLRTLFTSLLADIARADCFRIHIEVAEDGTFTCVGHCSAEPSPVAVTLRPAQSAGIAALINAIDGDD